MKYRISYSPDALGDLNEIWDNISNDLSNPRAAEKTVTKIMDAVDLLADFPEMGAPLSSVTAINSEFRFILSGNYMAFYHISDHEIYIDRVLYGRRDYLRVLFGEQSPT